MVLLMFHKRHVRLCLNVIKCIKCLNVQHVCHTRAWLTDPISSFSLSFLGYLRWVVVFWVHFIAAEIQLQGNIKWQQSQEDGLCPCRMTVWQMLLCCPSLKQDIFLFPSVHMPPILRYRKLSLPFQLFLCYEKSKNPSTLSGLPEFFIFTLNDHPLPIYTPVKTGWL
jgi:hypothetical protein